MRPRVYTSAAERQAAYRARKRNAQRVTFDPAQRGARVIRGGRLTVARCDDGRALLWLQTGTRGGAWLELTPAEQAWLVTALGACNSRDGELKLCDR